MSVTRLLLVRHAEPDAATRGRCYGRLDVGLSPSGQRSARALARALGGLGLAAVYASPARRAVESATPLAEALRQAPLLDERLREIDFGSFEGRSFAEIEQSEPELYREWMDSPTRVRFPGGESYPALRLRALEALEDVRSRHAGQTAALVAHGGPLRAMLAACLSMPDEALFRLDQGYAGVSVVEWTDERALVRLLNGTPRTAARRLAACAESAQAAPALAAPAPGPRLARPPLPEGFDDSRARSRGARPDGWRFAEDARAAVWRAVVERRDIRRFRPDPLPDAALRLLLEAAHRAPSVGLMQPWRFVVVRSEETKAAMQALAARERLVQADQFDERTRQYLDLKIEGIREAPLSICVCCDQSAGGPEVLGRHTIPETDLYSTCLAIENLWLVARAEGIGIGWVSFYRPEDVRTLLGLPPHVVPVAWLCVGYPDERPLRPGLEAAGWQQRRPLEGFVHAERWGGEPAAPAAVAAARDDGGTAAAEPPWWSRLAAGVAPGDHAEALRLRDASDELVKPAGSLGALEPLLERWAMVAGPPPPGLPRAGIIVFAADHGVAAQRVSLYPARVGAQVAAAAARGETAIGVLARALEAELVVVDVGLRGARLPGLVDRRVVEGALTSPSGPPSLPPSCAARSRPATRSGASSRRAASSSCSARSGSATRRSPRRCSPR